MLIRMTTSLVDGTGRVQRRRGDVCDVPDDEAQRLLDAGYATLSDADFESTVRTLRDGGITGVVAGPAASPKLLAAAEAGGLAVRHQHEAPPAPADTAPAPDPPAPKPKKPRHHRRT